MYALPSAVDSRAELFEVPAGSAAHIDPDAARRHVESREQLPAAVQQSLAEIIEVLSLIRIECFDPCCAVGPAAGASG